MSKNYTLEDVETLRRKSGCSYEEAVSLLDKYDGDIARALIELEKRGQLGASVKTARFSMDDFSAWCKKVWHKGLCTHLIIERKGETLVNLSLLILLLMLLLGPYAFIAAVLLVLVCGCSIRIQTDDMKNVTIINAEEDHEDHSDESPASEPETPEKPKDQDDDFPSITIS